MSCMDYNLVESWRRCSLDAPPYLFPGDQFLSELPSSRSIVSLYHSYEDFTTGPTFGSKSDTSVHLGLLPVPYVGDLQRSSIFVLMLNPGLEPGHYFAEETVQNFRTALIRNLRQENIDCEYPFLDIDPRFAWHPGSAYWLGKLQDITRRLAAKQGISYQTALSRLAQSLALLQLVPYHSRRFRLPPSVLNRLASTQMIVEYVHYVLVPRALNGDAVIIAIRGGQKWRLHEDRNIVVYEANGARSAHLTLSSRGGRAIAAQLGL